MQFKIGQPIITIMNMYNIIVQHTIIPLIYVPGHDLTSDASLSLDVSLSLIPAMNVHGIAKLHVL